MLPPLHQISSSSWGCLVTAASLPPSSCPRSCPACNATPPQASLRQSLSSKQPPHSPSHTFTSLRQHTADHSEPPSFLLWRVEAYWSIATAPPLMLRWWLISHGVGGGTICFSSSLLNVWFVWRTAKSHETALYSTTTPCHFIFKSLPLMCFISCLGSPH